MRLARAQSLMRAQGLSAILVEAGSSLNYFTGINWWRSERLTAAVLPAEGGLCVITPFFEQPSIQEMLDVPGEIRVWQEDENPFTVVAGWLKERKLATGKIGIEDTVRYFAVDGLQRALPDVAITNGGPVVTACRIRKSPAEIALMQRANDITIAAYRTIAPKISRGMGTEDISDLITKAMTTLGGEAAGGGVQINEGSALPHGSKEPQFVKDGSVILMDCGCTVHGYFADMSRTLIFGEPSKAQRKLWNDVRQGQEIVIAAAKIGAPAGTVDDAVRAFYESLGYGPGYRLPGLSHRSGHGVGLDVHEPVNLVHGEPMWLAEGMCFSNEPGLYVPGSYGFRIEDCFYMTSEGPRYFTQPPTSIEDPIG
jgi:Xaa-Pro dipeptidase